MARWANYLISAVKYDSDKRILQVKQHKDTGEAIEDGELVDRITIANNLKKGISYLTIFNSNSNWKIGDKIQFIRVGGDYSIRTDSNKVEFDNLKFLPEIE